MVVILCQQQVLEVITFAGNAQKIPAGLPLLGFF
jgi:hypothetical protein